MSLAFIPSQSFDIALRFPLHPPSKEMFLIVSPSRVKRISLEQVPVVLYVISSMWQIIPWIWAIGQKNLDIHIFVAYYICMIGTTKIKMKPVTLYLPDQLYVKYQLQAARCGGTAAELVRNAMELYAEENFGAKKSLSDLRFERTVRLKSGAKDFISDSSWREDFLSSGVRI